MKTRQRELYERGRRLPPAHRLIRLPVPDPAGPMHWQFGDALCVGYDSALLHVTTVEVDHHNRGRCVGCERYIQQQTGAKLT